MHVQEDFGEVTCLHLECMRMHIKNREGMHRWRARNQEHLYQHLFLRHKDHVLCTEQQQGGERANQNGRVRVLSPVESSRGS